MAIWGTAWFVWLCVGFIGFKVEAWSVLVNLQVQKRNLNILLARKKIDFFSAPRFWNSPFCGDVFDLAPHFFKWSWTSTILRSSPASSACRLVMGKDKAADVPVRVIVHMSCYELSQEVFLRYECLSGCTRKLEGRSQVKQGWSF